LQGFPASSFRVDTSHHAMRIRRTSALVLVGLVALSYAWACSGNANRDGSDDSQRGGGGAAGRSQIDTTIDGGGQRGGASGQDLNPLCGVGTCVPDDPDGCSDYSEGGSSNSPSGEAGTSSGAGTSSVDVSGSGGAAGAPNDGADGVGGAGGQSGGPDDGLGGQAGELGLGDGGAAGEGSSGAGGDRGSGGSVSATSGTTGSGAAPSDAGVDATIDGGDTPRPSGFACRVALDDEEPVRTCGRGGRVEAGMPCASAADCAAGLACVAEGQAGRCQPYCCASDATCDEGSFCAERPLYTGSSDAGPTAVVPVCAQADNCSLGDPYPCPAGESCRCAEGTACTVVRSDGTASCVPPGSGKAGESCPCAWSFVCSRATETCLKLCNTTDSTSECGSGRCQATSNLPSGWGVCTQAAQADAG
jgi:hypothetical protein